MQSKKLKAMTWSLMLLLSPILTVAAQIPEKVSVQEAEQIAEEAYIYGYPLITMEMTRRVITKLRLYWPKESPPSIIDGTWKIPAVQNVE